MVFYLGVVAGVASLFYTKLIFKKLEIIHFIIAIPLAYVSYLISLFIAGTKYSKSSLLFAGLKTFDKKTKKLLAKEIFINFKISASEELIYRGVIQYTVYTITNNIYFTIVISAIYFAACHYRIDRFVIQYMDIMGFSIIITILFQVTTYDVWLVIIVHTFRNLFIICEKYAHYNKTQKRLLQLSKKMNRFLNESEMKIKRSNEERAK